MKTLKKSVLSLLALCCLGLSQQAEARSANFDIGYGTKARGMGGLAVALPQDSMVGAVNPAGYSWLCDRIDIGSQVLAPVRKYRLNSPIAFIPPSTIIPLAGSYERGRPQILLIPELGFSKQLDCNSTVGFAAYLSGGDTTYKRDNAIASGQFRGLNKLNEKLGLTVKQLNFAFSYAYRFACNHSIGVSLITPLQSVEIKGAYGFDTPSLSAYPGKVTNNGQSHSFGVGFRVGYIGRFCDNITLGASYTTLCGMSKTRKYEGFVPDRGRVDIPGNVALGITYDVTPCARVGFEWQRFFYTQASVYGNPIQSFVAVPGGTKKIGAKGGPGFGWNDVNAYKVGGDYRFDDCLVVRAGYHYTETPFKNNQLDVNFLTQAGSDHHITFGATIELSPWDEIDIAYFHQFNVVSKGKSSIASQPRATYELNHYEDSISINYGWKY